MWCHQVSMTAITKWIARENSDLERNISKMKRISVAQISLAITIYSFWANISTQIPTLWYIPKSQKHWKNIRLTESNSCLRNAIMTWIQSERLVGKTTDVFLLIAWDWARRCNWSLFFTRQLPILSCQRKEFWWFAPKAQFWIGMLKSKSGCGKSKMDDNWMYSRSPIHRKYMSEQAIFYSARLCCAVSVSHLSADRLDRRSVYWKNGSIWIRMAGSQAAYFLVTRHSDPLCVTSHRIVPALRPIRSIKRSQNICWSQVIVGICRECAFSLRLPI